MFKALIVDDEYLSRFVLKTIINKKISSLKIAGEAENGRQAIEKSRELKPDLIIMDVKMPGINGMDAANEILNEFPDISILILTAYDNFEYIKRALDLGVKGYILKPVKEEDVVEKVNKVLGDIGERVNKVGIKEQIENKFKVIKPLIESELISSFISGNFDVDKVENYISFLQEEITSGYFMLVSPGQNYSRDINESIRNRILKEKILNIAGNHLPLMKKCYFGNSIGSTVIAFFPVNQVNTSMETCREAIMIGEELRSRIKLMADVDAAIGIGSVCTGIQNFAESYNEASLALKKAVREKTVVYFGDLASEEYAGKEELYPLELEDRLIDYIRIGNMEKAGETADDILLHVLNGNNRLEVIKECLTGFVSVLKRTARKAGVTSGITSSTGMLAELNVLNDIEEIDVWCKRTVRGILKLIEGKTGKSKEIVDNAFSYINKNFTKDITLESVADEIGISPQYLSKLFKEKYGSNFIDYITKKRVEYAGRLLARSSANIKEISKAAGYGDPNYFCKLFKKVTGLTPKQYKLQKVTGEF